MEFLLVGGPFIEDDLVVNVSTKVVVEMIELNQIDVLVSRYRHANVAYRHQERWKEQ